VVGKGGDGWRRGLPFIIHPAPQRPVLTLFRATAPRCQATAPAFRAQALPASATRTLLYRVVCRRRSNSGADIDQRLWAACGLPWRSNPGTTDREPPRPRSAGESQPAIRPNPHPIIVLISQPIRPISMLDSMQMRALSTTAVSKKNLRMKDRALTIRARRLSEPAFEFNHRFTGRETAAGSGMCSDANEYAGRTSAITCHVQGEYRRRPAAGLRSLPCRLPAGSRASRRRRSAWRSHRPATGRDRNRRRHPWW
jgi:hypothetical protein